MVTRTVAPAGTQEQSAFRQVLRDRAARRAEAWERRRGHAWAVAREGTRRLRAEFGARNVWLFGSLARGGPYDEHSDIDLAAAGIDPAEYLAAVRMLLGLDNAFLFDLVLLDEAPPPLLAIIQTEGVAL